MTMTLEQVLRAAAAEIEFLATKDQLVVTDHDRHRRLLASLRTVIDAYLAGMGEPVEHQYRRRMAGTPSGWSDWFHLHPENYDSAIGKDGVEVRPLYTAPPIDLAAVRKVIAEIRAVAEQSDHLLHGWANKLKSAIATQTKESA